MNDEFAGRFEVFVFGGRNTLFSWSQMALVAPLEKIEGGIEGLALEEGKGAQQSGNGNGTYSGPPAGSAARRLVARGVGMLGLIVGLVAFDLST